HLASVRFLPYPSFLPQSFAIAHSQVNFSFATSFHSFTDFFFPSQPVTTAAAVPNKKPLVPILRCFFYGQEYRRSCSRAVIVPALREWSSDADVHLSSIPPPSTIGCMASLLQKARNDTINPSIRVYVMLRPSTYIRRQKRREPATATAPRRGHGDTSQSITDTRGWCAWDDASIVPKRQN
ncbi:unnamed protein product, partial [Ectocarpus sp. 6 AP-2014]